MRLIVVPRGVLAEVWHLPWSELCLLADRGDRGITYATGNEGYVLLREGQGRDGSLVGKSLVYFQGWVSVPPPEQAELPR